jgi:hypothetical protein
LAYVSSEWQLIPIIKKNNSDMKKKCDFYPGLVRPDLIKIQPKIKAASDFATK